MIKALRALKAEFYTPYAERDSVTPTRFLLRPLDGLEQLSVRNGTGRDAFGNITMTTEAATAALKHGLQGWEHLLDEDGSPVAFHLGDRDANLKRLPAELVAELALEIFIASILTEQERKNLSSLPTSRPSSASPSTAAPASGDATATIPILRASSSG